MLCFYTRAPSDSRHRTRRLTSNCRRCQRSDAGAETHPSFPYAAKGITLRRRSKDSHCSRTGTLRFKPRVIEYWRGLLVWEVCSRPDTTPAPLEERNLQLRPLQALTNTEVVSVCNVRGYGPSTRYLNLRLHQSADVNT